MFVIRSIFWLGTVVLLLPPSADGETPAPRVSILAAAAAVRTIVADLGSVCERNPSACATSGEALVALGRKLETGADIVGAGLSAGREADPPLSDGIDHGTLGGPDLSAPWGLPSS